MIWRSLRPNTARCPDGHPLSVWHAGIHHFEIERLPSCWELFYLHFATDAAWACEVRAPALVAKLWYALTWVLNGALTWVLVRMMPGVWR